LEQLAHHAEWKISLELAAARGAHGQVTLLGEHPRLGEQERLADPGRPFDEHEACRALRSRENCSRECLEPVLPLEYARPARPPAGARAHPSNPSGVRRHLGVEDTWTPRC